MWTSVAGLDYNFFFTPGLFMLTAGLIVAAVARFTAKGFVRTQAAGSLRFHLWLLLAIPAWALLFVVAMLFETPNPTMDHPPAYLIGVLGIGAFAFGLILPFVELVRALIGVSQARKQPIPSE